MRPGRGKLVLVAGVAAATVLAGFAGPLFAYAPIKPGFAHLELRRADVWYPAGRALPAAYREIDTYIEQAERFLDLPMRRRVPVVLARDWSDFTRFWPPLGLRRLGGAITLGAGWAIYVSPRVDEKGFDHGEFLRHEIAHAVMAQNTGLWNFHQMAPSSWYFEGTPVWFSRARAFVTQPEFQLRAAQADLGALIDPARGGSTASDYRFSYIVWRNFLDYLDQTRGRGAMLGFLHGVLQDQAQTAVLFERHFGVTLHAAIDEFSGAVRVGRFHAVEAVEAGSRGRALP